MELEFDDRDLEDMIFNERYSGEIAQSLVKMVRRCINYLIQAPDRRAIYNFPGYHLEKLKGDMKGFHSLRLNDQYRLIIQFVASTEGEIIRVISMGDYH